MESTLIKLTQLLNDGQYHNGTTLGDKLNISRAAIWKIVKRLQQYGIAITSVKGKGYILETPLILLSEKKIKAGLLQKNCKLILLEKVDSTNTYLEKRELNTKSDVVVCLAEVQTQGKGRLNRHWHSPFGQNIYLSMRYFFQRDMSELSGLSLVVGLAICHALETSLILKDKIYVKWPNDIVVAAQKIAGVLIEAQAEANGYCRVVMGMGINVNMQHAAQDEINQAWQALQNLTGSYIDRNILVINLINTLIDYLERFSQEGLKSFITQWERKDILFGHPVQLRPISKEYQGIGAGINAQGHLLLKNEHGIHAFSCGDTSLLKESK